MSGNNDENDHDMEGGVDLDSLAIDASYDPDATSEPEDEAELCYGSDDDRNNESDGSEDPAPEVTGIAREPRDKLANKLSFYKICEVLDFLATSGTKKSKKEKLNLLLPAPLLKRFREKSEKVPESMFPLFRLLMQDKDSSRTFSTKEKSLATAYSDALGFDKTNQKSIMLHNWTDPVKLASIHSAKEKVAGDFSLVVEKVLTGRVSKTPSEATVGDLNRLLDKLANDLDKARQTKSASNWSSASQSQSQRSQSQSQFARRKKKTKKKKNHKLIREEFLKALTEELKLSPMEQKWTVRILLGESLKIGVGSEPILDWYSPHARELWKSHNSLKAVCYKACDPNYIRQREIELKEEEERRKEQRFCRLYTFPANPDPIRINNTISAMKSDRTSFESCMSDLSARHLDVINKKLPKDDPARECLALKFPAFVSEVKLDGERMLIHVNRGEVTMHTRNGRWYSRLYSPILGPNLRRAIAKYDVDVILDVEIAAWDDGRKEPVPFGSNRTVAILRRKWLTAHGLMEDIDKGLHKGESDAHIVAFADLKTFDKDNADSMSAESGELCWLHVTAFDVIYVAGPDAEKIFTDSLSDEPSLPEAGSITHLSGFERKRILYRLIETQKDKVEIVQSLVIRPNGDCVRGEEYFSSADPIMECGFPVYMLDSAKWTLNIGHKLLKEFDENRRKRRTDIDISKRRTHYVNHFYHSIVEEQKLEGLVFKDLTPPYILRNHSRWWLKIKPDYSHDSFASDLDVVVIGSCWASGMRSSGQLSSFLCGCVDSKDPKKFFTFCRVNANSLKDGKLEQVMEHTEFKKATATDPVSFGKWFTEEEHGTSLPDFISSRSFQDGKEDDDGWRFSKPMYPDLFINPDDSVVITVNASEIVPSDEYSAGVTLRFPRATKLRLGEGEKPASEVEDEERLYRLLSDYEEKRSQFARATSSSAGLEMVSPSKSQPAKEKTNVVARFQTAEQYRRSKKNRIKSRKVAGRVQSVVVPKKQSNALTGLKFFVLEGSYSFDTDSADAEEAKIEGWFEEATAIHQAIDVMSFIKKHNGTVLRSPGLDVRVIGGSSLDYKVVNNIRGYEKLKEKDAKKRKKSKAMETSDVDVPGVLTWTYVLSVVFRWLKEKEAQKQELRKDDNYSSDDEDDDDDDDEDECILLTIPHVLDPRFFDYLAQSEKYGDDPYESIWRHGNLDTIGMKRATSFLQDSSAARLSSRPKKSRMEQEEAIVPWQHAGLKNLPAEDRWVLSCQYEKLWPYSGVDDDLILGFTGAAVEEQEAAIVYADLFGDDFGLEEKEDAYDDDRADERWKNVSSNVQLGALASSLPLLRSLGCLVTCHLHGHVTHVLCELAEGKDSVLWQPGVAIHSFFDEQHGNKLWKRLEDTFERPVLLVSRRWVVSEWN